MNQISLVESDPEEGSENNLPVQAKSVEENFESLWQIFKQITKAGLGAHGPKNKALAQFKKLSLDHEDIFNLIERIKSQANHKARLRNKKEFFSPFPHAFRYLRDERWDEEIPDPEQCKSIVSAEDVEARIAEKMDRSWAE